MFEKELLTLGNKCSNRMVQSKLVLSKGSVATKKPSTANTRPVKQLFTVLIQADFWFEALEADATCVEDVDVPWRISQTAGANAINTLQESLPSPVPHSVAKLKAILRTGIIRWHWTATLRAVAFHLDDTPIVSARLMIFPSNAAVTPVVPWIRMKTATTLTSSTMLHFVHITVFLLKPAIVVVAPSSPAIPVQSLVTKTWTFVIFFVVNIHVFGRSSPSRNLQIISSPGEWTSVFFESCGTVQKRGIVKHVFQVFNSFRPDVLTFPNFLQLLQHPKPPVVESVPFPFLCEENNFNEWYILYQDFSVLYLGKGLQKRNTIVKSRSN